MSKKNIIIIVFLLSSVLASLVIRNGSSFPCNGQTLMPSVQFGEDSVIVGNSEPLYEGQSYRYSHGGIWFADIKLLNLDATGAMLLYHFQDPGGGSYTCRQYISKQESSYDQHFSYSTNDPEGLRPLLFRPEDLDGNWVVETYVERTQGLWAQSPTIASFEDKIQASIVAEPVPITKLYSHEYIPHRVFQTVFVYIDEATAIASFEENNFPYPLMPTRIDYQPHLKNHESKCYQTQNVKLQCDFWGQYDQYLIWVTMPIDGELITMEDWENMLAVVQERLINHVEQELELTPSAEDP